MTAFATRLQTITQLADRDPQTALRDLLLLPDQAQTAADVLQLGALLTQVGAVLKRFNETVTAIAGLRTHALVADVPEVRRSLWRAEGVLRHCAGSSDAEARANGIANESDACRYAGALARTLAASGRPEAALPFLREAATRCALLSPDDPVLAQTAAIAAGFSALAQRQLEQARDLVLAAAAATAASEGRHPEWQRRHLSVFSEVRALLLSGQPGAALRAIPTLMDLEDSHQAGAFQRFHTAALACRAYHARGDAAQAARTLEACRDFASRATGHDLSADVAQLARLVQGEAGAAAG